MRIWQIFAKLRCKDGQKYWIKTNNVYARLLFERTFHALDHIDDVFFKFASDFYFFYLKIPFKKTFYK